jgi:hypothetical protein
MDGCQQDSNHTFVCRLNRDGSAQWIVWNPDGVRNFEIPASWHAASVTPLLEQSRAITGTTENIGPSPVLLTASSNR